MLLTCIFGHAQGLGVISITSKAEHLCNDMLIFTLVDLLKNKLWPV